MTMSSDKFDENVGSLSGEDRMGLDCNRYVEIAGWTAIDAVFTFACQAKAHAGIDSRGNGDR